MNNLWLKIKIWTKFGVLSLAGLYALIFIYNNSTNTAEIWTWFGRKMQPPILFLIFVTFFLGVITTVLMRITLKTIRQVRELREKTKSDKLHRDIADMKSKAAMLQTKPVAASSPSEPPSEM